MNDGLIGVIVPAHNAERYVVATLESLAAQSYTNWRAIVVDDGSSDATAQVVTAFAQRDGRVSLLRQANRGVSGARNAGMRAMLRGGARYLCFLDSDDLLVPDAFDVLVGALVPRPDAVGVSGLAEAMDTDGRPLGTSVHSSMQRHRRTFLVGSRPTVRRILTPHIGRALLPGEDTTFDSLANSCPMWPPATTLVRAESLSGVEGYDESLGYMEDWDFFLKLARRGPFVFIDRQVAWYRRRSGDLAEVQWDAAYHCAKQTVRYRSWTSLESSPAQRRDLARVHRLYAASLATRQLRHMAADVAGFRWPALGKDWARLRYALRLLVHLHPVKPDRGRLEVLG